MDATAKAAEPPSLADFGMQVVTLALAVVVAAGFVFLCRRLYDAFKTYVFAPLLFVAKVAASILFIVIALLLVQLFLHVGTSSLSPALQQYIHRWHEYVDLVLHTARNNAFLTWAASNIKL